MQPYTLCISLEMKQTAHPRDSYLRWKGKRHNDTVRYGEAFHADCSSFFEPKEGFASAFGSFRALVSTWAAQ